MAAAANNSFLSFLKKSESNPNSLAAINAEEPPTESGHHHQAPFDEMPEEEAQEDFVDISLSGNFHSNGGISVTTTTTTTIGIPILLTRSWSLLFPPKPPVEHREMSKSHASSETWPESHSDGNGDLSNYSSQTVDLSASGGYSNRTSNSQGLHLPLLTFPSPSLLDQN